MAGPGKLQQQLIVDALFEGGVEEQLAGEVVSAWLLVMSALEVPKALALIQRVADMPEIGDIRFDPPRNPYAVHEGGGTGKLN